MASPAHYLYMNPKHQEIRSEGRLFTTVPCACDCGNPCRYFDLVELKKVSEVYPDGHIPTNLGRFEADIKIKLIFGTEIIGYFTVRIKQVALMRARKDVSRYLKCRVPQIRRLLFMTMYGIEDKILKKLPNKKV